MNPPNNLCVILCAFLFFSCSQSLDFDQIEDYTSESSFSLSLAFFTIDATNFTAAVGAPIITEISDFKLFENSYIKENLIKLDFDIEIRNDFNRDFTMKISLLDKDDTLIYELQHLKVAANKLDFKHKEFIDIAIYPNVKHFSRVEIKLSLDDKLTPVEATDIGEINFKSAAIIHLQAPL
ncbi:hypothetical protein [Polaribacter sp. IC073]|uniref:hypothetical protein n=1 Tax=Polaribacter sp. IC073 TaxID=2508540 RepID=UPI0011BF9C91|nr:hypothetical protein [Polaribacter sp. IC073]TXD46636.1 hypothetical protein ES045_13930 [Polaribacter sp. IC073]